MYLTVTEDVTAILGVVTQIATQVFAIVGDLAELVMGNALLLIPIAVIMLYTGIKVFKMIF